MVLNTYALVAQGGDTNVFSQAGVVALMGMATIFVVLSLLWVAVEVMHRLLHRDKNSESSSKDSKAAQVANPDDAAIAAAIAAALAAAEDDGAVVAAITAAITAARAEEGNNTPFRVVSFKRAERKRGYRR